MRSRSPRVLARTLVALTASIALGGCATCREHQTACDVGMIVGVVVVTGAAASLANQRIKSQQPQLHGYW